MYILSRQNSQSRENINFPEDEVVGGSEGERGADEQSPSTGQGTLILFTLSTDIKTITSWLIMFCLLTRFLAGPSMALPRPTATPTNLPPGEEPVNVTITVMASS